MEKVNIKLGNVYSKIEGHLPMQVWNEVDHRTSFQVPGYYFSKLYKRGVWDGRKHLLWKISQLFPTGLAGYVCDALQYQKYPYQVEDCRKKPKYISQPLELRGIKLRDYQVEAINAGIRAGRGILDLAGGGGKTEVISGITKVLDLPSLIVTHRVELLYQTGTRIQNQTGIIVGYIGDGNWRPEKVTVAMIETLATSEKKLLKEFLDSIDVLIIDEGHLLAAKVFYSIIQKCNAYFRYILSATPLMRDDNRNLMVIGATGPIIFKVGAAQLIKEKVLAEPKVEFLRVDAGVPITGKSYQEIYENGITNNEFRNSLILKKVKEHKGDQVLVLVRIIKHGKNLQTLFAKEGVKSEFIWGDDEGDHRRNSLDDFKRRKLKVLVSSIILKEGVDIPAIDVLIVASGTKSKITTLQSLGRALRRTKQKTKALIVDFTDYNDSYLLKHSKRRLEIYQNEGFDISVSS
ncbi:ATP-dependent RNA helicase SrmB [subsurface metagenome]